MTNESYLDSTMELIDPNSKHTELTVGDCVRIPKMGLCIVTLVTVVKSIVVIDHTGAEYLMEQEEVELVAKGEPIAEYGRRPCKAQTG